MTGADGERPVKLRIGGWLPPGGHPGTYTTEGTPTDRVLPAQRRSPPRTAPPLTASDPVAPTSEPAAPVPGQFQPACAATWIPPATAPPLGEQPAHRRSRIGPPRVLRSCAFLLVAVAIAAGVPLVLGLASAPPGPVRQTMPRPTVLAPPAESPARVVPPSITGPPTSSPTATPSVSGSEIRVVPGDPVTTAPPTRPSSPAVTISIEAEGPSAVRGGEAESRRLAAASGGTVVTGIGGNAANLVRFVGVTVPQAGSYSVTFHYVATERLRARVTVGGQLAIVQFTPSGNDWGTVGTVSVRLSLTAGSNTIEFGNKNAPAPDLDRIVVTN